MLFDLKNAKPPVVVEAVRKYGAQSLLARPNDELAADVAECAARTIKDLVRIIDNMATFFVNDKPYHRVWYVIGLDADPDPDKVWINKVMMYESPNLSYIINKVEEGVLVRKTQASQFVYTLNKCQCQHDKVTMYQVAAEYAGWRLLTAKSAGNTKDHLYFCKTEIGDGWDDFRCDEYKPSVDEDTNWMLLCMRHKITL